MTFICIFVYLYVMRNTFCLAENIKTYKDGNIELPDLASLCPYNQYCKSPSVSAEPEGVDSCCEKCSCEPDCHETGSCCYDAQTSGSASSKYQCIPLSEFSKDELGLLPDDNEDLQFQVITDCPDNAKEIENQKCHLPTDIEDFVIVSDPQSGKVYRNKHCAECNNINRYEFWKVDLACLELKSIFEMKSFEDMKHYVEQKCSLISHPPHKNAGRMSFCIPNIISKCNVTGRWDVYEEEIFEACNENRESQNAAFRVSDISPHVDIYYSSVYCFLCNKPKSLLKNDECDVVDPYITKTIEFIRILGDIETQIDKKFTNGPELECKSFEIWDPFKEFCRLLVCPEWKKPLNGRCIGLFSNIYGLTFSLAFELTFIKGQMPKANMKLLSLLDSVIYKKLGKNLKCGKCSTMLFSNMTFPDTIFVQVEFFTTKSCMYDVMLRKVRQLTETEQMYFKLGHDGKVADIKFKPTFERFFGNDMYKVDLYMKYNECPVSKHIDSELLQQCDRIMISHEEASDLDIASLATNERGRRRQPVCLDTYFSIHTAKSAANPVNSKRTTQFLQINLILWVTIARICNKRNI